MEGKHVAITGPTAGIGRSAAEELARRGARLTLLCRNPEKGQALSEELLQLGAPEVDLVEMEMSSLASVRSAAASVLSSGEPIDVLLNNAGVVNTRRHESADGFEETLAVNHLAPFLLTGLLLPALRQAPQSRIVNVASAAHAFVRDMGFDDMQASKSYKTFREYGRSKLANILFTRSLAQRLEGGSITVNCLHPGAVSTSLGTNNGTVGKILTKVLKPFFRSPEKGAQTSIYLCCSQDVADVSGAYFVDCRQRKPKPWALDDDAAQRLWLFSEHATGFTYPAE